MTTLRDELLAENHGDARIAASNFASRLTKDDPETFKVGYTRENAILAAVELFPEVTPNAIRHWNRWSAPIELTIKAVDLTAVTDAVNETLRALALEGDIEDDNDDGWAWTHIEGLEGTEGQDRDDYSDTQDRDSYVPDGDAL